MAEPLKVLIVDDSLIFRSAIEGSLQEVDDIQVIGSVRNGVKAIEFIRSQRPDLVTLDVEMPEMDGLETLRAIQEVNAEENSLPPIGAIMLSALTHKGADTTIEALEMGAFDFIAKPRGLDAADGIESLKRKLLTKIRYFASKKLASKLTTPTVVARSSSRDSRVAPETAPRSQIKAILVGVSTGGPRALMEMLPRLCEVTDLPIFVVQHMPPTFTQSLATSLDAKCRATVIEGRKNDVARSGHVYIAPGGQHMLLRREGYDILTVLNEQPPENGCRPAADVLFRSAIPVYGGDVLGLILTGMGCDGARGCGALKRAGAHVIAQDEETSVVWGMPGSAVNAGNVDEIRPLMEIPEAVEAVIRQPAL